MKVIFKEDDEAFDFLKHELEKMISSAVKGIMEKIDNKEEKQEELWCDSKRAQEILKCKKTKLQQLRDHSPDNGIILTRHGRKYEYYVPSLHEFKQRHIIR